MSTAVDEKPYTSVCPGCGQAFKHGSDASEFYEHTKGCKSTAASIPVPREELLPQGRSVIAKAEEEPVKKFFTILQMIPSIIGIVGQVESQIVGPKQGPTKLNTVLATVNAAVSAVPEVQQALAGHDLNATVTSIVKATVDSINAAYQTASEQTPPPPPPPAQQT